jgi:hypothetical protein
MKLKTGLMDKHGQHRLCWLSQKSHIPPDLVVDQWVSNVESSSPRDFLLRHAPWTTFCQLLWSQITSAISMAWGFTTKSGGMWVFQHVPLFLAAITRFLFSRVVGARDGSLGAVMTKRGATGGGVLCPASAGDMSSDKDGISTPRRACKASTLREGASPKVRRVLRNTGSKT